eukprot:tig00021366_g20855.t1
MRHPDSGEALEALLEAAAARADEIEPQGASNLAWAMGSLKRPNAALLAGVARVARERAAAFSPQALCNVAWSFAALEVDDAELFDAVAAEALRRLEADPRALTPQARPRPRPALAFPLESHAASTSGAATLAWAFSHRVCAAAAARDAVPPLRPRDSTDDNAAEAAAAEALDVLELPAASALASPSPSPCSQASSWASGGAPLLEGLAGPIPRLFAALARVVAAQRSSGRGSVLTGEPSPPSPRLEGRVPRLFSYLFPNLLAFLAIDPFARVAAAPQAHDFPPHALTTVASAFGSLHGPQPALFAAIGRAAVRRMAAFDAGDVADLAGSFATLRHGDLVPEFVPAAAARVREVAPQLSSFQMNRVCWAFGAVFKYDDPRLVAALEAEIGARVAGSGLDPMDAANVALGLAYLQAGERALLRGLAAGALARLAGMDPRGAVNLAWAIRIRASPPAPPRAPALSFEKTHEAAASLLAAAFPAGAPAPPRFPAGGLGQLGCIRLALQLERPDLLPSFPRTSPPPSTPTSPASGVAADLARVRPGYVEEHFAGVYFLDFAWVGERVALEVDGPSHFLAVSGRFFIKTVNLYYLFLERLLSAAGWRVLHLSHSDWRALPGGPPQRGAFLRRLFSEEAAPAPAPGEQE